MARQVGSRRRASVGPSRVQSPGHWTINPQVADEVAVECRCCPRAADHVLGDKDQGREADGAKVQVHHEPDCGRVRTN